MFGCYINDTNEAENYTVNIEFLEDKIMIDNFQWHTYSMGVEYRTKGGCEYVQ